MIRLPRLILLLAFGAALVVSARAAPVSNEDRKIEALLAYIGEQKEVVFIRNGSDHPPATAVKFLRGKWDRARNEVKTARAFIDKVATKSSTTGQPYRIRLPDNTEIDCATFLSAKLDELEKPR